MVLNEKKKGEIKVTADSIKVTIVNDQIYLRGKCGRSYNFSLMEWGKLKKKVKKAIKAENKPEEKV